MIARNTAQESDAKSEASRFPPLATEPHSAPAERLESAIDYVTWTLSDKIEYLGREITRLQRALESEVMKLEGMSGLKSSKTSVKPPKPQYIVRGRAHEARVSLRNR